MTMSASDAQIAAWQYAQQAAQRRVDDNIPLPVDDTGAPIQPTPQTVTVPEQVIGPEPSPSPLADMGQKAMDGVTAATVAEPPPVSPTLASMEPGAAPAGRPPQPQGGVIPGGMRPYTEERDIHYSKGVGPGVKEAQGGAFQDQLESNRLGRDADQQYFEQEKHILGLKASAAESARLQQQRLAEDRDAEATKRLAHIETLNTEARGKPEDLWSSGTILGKVGSILLLTLGGVSVLGGNVAGGLAMSMAGLGLNGLINQDIQAKVDERRQAGQQAKAETSLYNMHLEHLGDQKKAIEATKMAYYDNILQQMDTLKADRNLNISEPKYLALRAKILEDKADTMQKLHLAETDDEHAKQVNKYAPPVAIGGGGGAGAGLHDIPNTITLSDNTTWQLGTSPDEQKSRERIIAMQKLQTVNDGIKKLRREAYALDPMVDKEKYQSIYARLEDLGGQKAPLMSMALDGSTIRKDEREAIEKTNIMATEGLGVPGVPYSNKIPLWSKAHQVAADAVIEQQQSLWHKGQLTEATASGARQVQRGYVTDEHGNKQPVAKYAGVDAAPDEHAAPPGYKPDDPSARPATQVHVQGKPAPDFGRQDTPTAPTGKRKKK
jgi:hypothetical protein